MRDPYSREQLESILNADLPKPKGKYRDLWLWVAFLLGTLAYGFYFGTTF
jgi:hypothetical protein